MGFLGRMGGWQRSTSLALLGDGNLCLFCHCMNAWQLGFLQLFLGLRLLLCFKLLLMSNMRCLHVVAKGLVHLGVDFVLSMVFDCCGCFMFFQVILDYLVAAVCGDIQPVGSRCYEIIHHTK